MPQTGPTWITLAWRASLVLAIMATFGVLLGGGNEVSHRDNPIADRTVNLNGRPVREHCTTCHPRGARPDPERIDRTVAPHPDIAPHLPDELGCTGCHLGEGMALDLTISHGLPGQGARTVLSGDSLQASCYRCHPLAPLPGAEAAWQGYRLFVAKGCSSCHRLAGLPQSGYFGPELSDIGAQFGLDQLERAIREPRDEPANSIMPRFPLSGSQIRKLAYFLKSRIDDPAYATPMELRSGDIRLPELDLVPAGSSLAAGEELLYRGQCLACHKFGDRDGRIGPDLTYIGALRSEDFQRRFLASPSALIPGARMPGSPLAEDEKERLVAFLEREAVGPVTAVRKLPEQAGPAVRGKVLYMQLCQRCHAAKGDGHGPIQPNLANFPRPFLDNAAYFRTRTAEQLIARIEKGIPGTSMPPYRELLDRRQVEDVLQLVTRAFIAIDLPQQVDRPPLPNPPDRLPTQQRQERLFAELCVRCHGRAGTGNGPEAEAYLPRPRNLRNTLYFAAMNDEELARIIASGVPGTGMPAFAGQLDAAQLWGLVDRVRRVSAGRQEEVGP